MTIQIFIQEKNLTNANTTVTPVLLAIPHMLCINEVILVFHEVLRDNFTHSHVAHVLAGAVQILEPVTPVLQAIPHMLCINELILVFSEVPRNNLAHSHMCGAGAAQILAQ